MKLTNIYGSALLAVIAGSAGAESLDRNALPLEMLFESGNAVRLAFTAPNPDVSSAPAGGTGSVLSSYTTLDFAYKQQLNDRMDLGLFLGEPYGALGNSAGTAAGGQTLEVQSSEVAAVLKYKLENNVSVYGGIRVVKSDFDFTLPVGTPGLAGGYALSMEDDTAVGYLAGVSLAFPERGGRIGLTYHSKVKHALSSSELGLAALPVTGTTNATMPQSVTLDGRTALNSNTLIFGSIKWSDYSGFALAAPGLTLVDYTEDAVTANVGIGRKINDEWSVFGILDWTKSDGKATVLRPYDGATGLTLGTTYASGQIKITGGAQYKKFGDATAGGNSYTGGTALTPFLQVGYSF